MHAHSKYSIFIVLNAFCAMKQLKYQLKSFEKIPLKIWESSVDASEHVAQSIGLAIRQKEQEGENIVLGLATGSSPIKVYEHLIRMHKEEGLSFKNVITFNLDEYYPMDKKAQQSYVRFMHEYLFDHVDIPKKNINIPNGEISIDKVGEHCDAYEKKILDNGGIDIQILGIGRTGHIGFNEPGSWETSITRLVKLDNLTRRDAIKDFPSSADVPLRAITMGMKTILNARTIYIMAWGAHKADIVKEVVEGEITNVRPASFLQNHENVKFFVDKGAASELTREKSPWLVGMCVWDKDMVTKAVIWLSQELQKPILKLTDEDYNEKGLSELVIEHSSAYQINIDVFNRLQNTITGWPGGKPKADDSTRPERAKPDKKRTIVFSPHPDDDVISMGGTFIRLIDQGHEVHVAYQTSGNIAVHDHDALKYIEFIKELGVDQKLLKTESKKFVANAQKFLGSKKASDIDSPDLRLVKGLIRKGEARAGARYCGLEDKNIHFLDLPFYETGKQRKNPISEADVDIVVELLNKIKPHQIFAAGDLADPHGTHRVCLDVIFEAMKRVKKKAWAKDCWLWLYRGAWHEYQIDEIEMAVPISPEELVKKRQAIFMHQSQKDSPPFPGSDMREFWQRAEERNRETAKLYRSLGLAEYEAMEAFRRWKF